MKSNFYALLSYHFMQCCNETLMCNSVQVVRERRGNGGGWDVRVVLCFFIILLEKWVVRGF